MLKEIGSKWSKVSEQDLSALKKVTTAQVASKYGLEKAQARRDVGCLAEGPSYSMVEPMPPLRTADFIDRQRR